jgi:hypothetical protein
MIKIKYTIEIEIKVDKKWYPENSTLNDIRIMEENAEQIASMLPDQILNGNYRLKTLKITEEKND